MGEREEVLVEEVEWQRDRNWPITLEFCTLSGSLGVRQSVKSKMVDEHVESK